MLTSWNKRYDKPIQCIKKQRHYFADKALYSQSYGFSSCHVWMWELGHKKAECKELILSFKVSCWRSTLDSKKIKPANPKGYQPWIFTGRTDAEAEAPILWLPDTKQRLTGKDPDAGKDWGQKKGTTEDKMVGWQDVAFGKLKDGEFLHVLMIFLADRRCFYKI